MSSTYVVPTGLVGKHAIELCGVTPTDLEDVPVKLDSPKVTTAVFVGETFKKVTGDDGKPSWKAAKSVVAFYNALKKVSKRDPGHTLDLGPLENVLAQKRDKSPAVYATFDPRNLLKPGEVTVHYRGSKRIKICMIFVNLKRDGIPPRKWQLAKNTDAVLNALGVKTTTKKTSEEESEEESCEESHEESREESMVTVTTADADDHTDDEEDDSADGGAKVEEDSEPFRSLLTEELARINGKAKAKASAKASASSKAKAAKTKASPAAEAPPAAKTKASAKAKAPPASKTKASPDHVVTKLVAY